MNKLTLLSLVALATAAPALGMEHKKSIDDINSGRVEVVYSKNRPKGFLHLGKGYQENDPSTDMSGIEKIPGFFGIEDLSIYGNNLDELPPAIFKCNNLKRLAAHGNCLKTVPEDLALLQNLVELELDHNLLTEIPFSILERLHNLQRVTTHRNKICYTPEDYLKAAQLFKKLKDLQEFWIHDRVSMDRELADDILKHKEEILQQSQQDE